VDVLVPVVLRRKWAVVSLEVLDDFLEVPWEGKNVGMLLL